MSELIGQNEIVNKINPRNWERILFNKKLLGQLCVLQMCLVGFSTPITSTIPYFTGLDSSPINIAFNAFYLSISIYLIIGAATKKQLKYISYGGWLILTFWLLYSARIVYDTQIVGLRFKNSLFVFYSVAFGNCLLSTIAVILNAKYVRLVDAKSLLLFFLFLSNLVIVFLVYEQYETLNPVDIAARVNFAVITETGTKSLLNPITTATFGEYLALFSIGCLLLLNNSFFKKCILFLGTITGIYVLVIGASRGPMVSFLFLLILLIIVRLIWVRKSRSFYLRILLVPIVASFLISNFVLPKIQLEDIRIFVRITDFIESRKSGVKESRDFQWEAAWEQFVENPLLGDQFLEKYANFYPHNIYLESLMALGVVGGCVMFFLMLYVLQRIYLQVVNRKKVFIFSIVLLAIMVGNAFSGSLFGSFKFWQLTAFVCSMSSLEVRKFDLI